MASTARAIATAHNEFLTAQFNGLPPLPAIEKLSPRVWRILGGNPGKFSLQGTNTYLIGTGKERFLIDTAQGHQAWIDSLISVLKDESVTIKKAFITHYHHDHVGGIDDLRRHSPTTVFHKNDPWDDQFPISDGEEFSVEGATLTAVHTPGHTPDHMCFVLKEENALFTGDNVLGHGTSVFQDLSAYMKSLARMQDLKTARGYPGHGQVLEDSQQSITTYITHRQRRENQILNHLKQLGGHEAVTSLELVKRIYTDVDENLHLAAEGGTVQVLDKLEKDGVVRGEAAGGDGKKRWTLVNKGRM